MSKIYKLYDMTHMSHKFAYNENQLLPNTLLRISILRLLS